MALSTICLIIVILCLVLDVGSVGDGRGAKGNLDEC